VLSPARNSLQALSFVPALISSKCLLFSIVSYWSGLIVRQLIAASELAIGVYRTFEPIITSKILTVGKVFDAALACTSHISNSPETQRMPIVNVQIKQIGTINGWMN